MPIGQRPRTPSEPTAKEPPYSTPERAAGLGLEEYESPVIRTHHDYDIEHGISDSPTKQRESGRTDSAFDMLSPAFPSTAGSLSPNGSLYTPFTPQTTTTDGGAFPQLEPGPNPFNFTSTPYVSGKGKEVEAFGRRKGHKYRHSSMHAAAMDSILHPPALRTPLAVPASLPIPTGKEVKRSLTLAQKCHLGLCLCRFAIAGYVQFLGMGSMAVTALSRLLVYDAARATVRVIVDVMSNFDVWKRSSIKHPFGLERSNVLAGFGLAVFVSFMGLDIITHGLEHSLEDVGTHEPHTAHAHDRVSTVSINIAAALAIFSTLISFSALNNQKRPQKGTRFSLFVRSLGNASRFLTLACSLLLLLFPNLSSNSYKVIDFVLSLLIAISMVLIGLRQGMNLASMLLMSYPTRSYQRGALNTIIDEIETDPSVSVVQEAKFWQVHYGLCIANLKLRFRGGEDEMSRLRQSVVSLIRQRLVGVRRAGPGPTWEISVQMTLEKD